MVFRADDAVGGNCHRSDEVAEEDDADSRTLNNALAEAGPSEGTRLPKKSQ